MTRSILTAAAVLALLAIAPIEAAQAQTAGRHAAPRPAAPRFTLDTPLGEIAADPQGRALLDRRTPGLVGSPHFLLVRGRSFRQLSVDPHAQGLTPEALARIEADLRAIR